MYSKRPNIVIGFHGCDKSVCDKIARGEDILIPSTNDYDWLGHGIYFWENNLTRALAYAQQIKDNPKMCKSQIDTPAAIGAVIDLGKCLDLLDSENIDFLRIGHDLLLDSSENYGFPMPVNKPLTRGGGLIIRKLDCAVIETVHTMMKNEGKAEFDSVRAVFFEGEPIYKNAGFLEKNHIQICIRNPNCIKGFFIPRDKDSEWELP